MAVILLTSPPCSSCHYIYDYSASHVSEGLRVKGLKSNLGERKVNHKSEVKSEIIDALFTNLG